MYIVIAKGNVGIKLIHTAFMANKHKEVIFMKKPEFLGLSAVACIANPVTAVAAIGPAGEAIAAAGAICNLPAVVPILGGVSIIA
ncbi:MAG: hypothetical protein WCD89_07615 [Anaerocolumna sp.]